MGTTQGNGTSPRASALVKDEPDHLLVLVHGIMARYVSIDNYLRIYS